MEKSSVRNAKELVNYLITEVIRHVQCVVELQMRLVPHALAQVELPLPLAPVVHSLNVRENWRYYTYVIVLRKNYGEVGWFDKIVDNLLIYNVDNTLLMSTYYSGEDEMRKKQKEELTPKKDTSGSTFSEENIDSSDTEKHQTAETVEAVESKDAGSGKGLKQKDLDAEEPE